MGVHVRLAGGVCCSLLPSPWGQRRCPRSSVLCRWRSQCPCLTSMSPLPAVLPVLLPPPVTPSLPGKQARGLRAAAFSVESGRRDDCPAAETQNRSSPLPSLSRGRNKLFLDTAQCFLSQETLPYVQEVLPDPKASNVALVLSAPPAAGWQRTGNSPGTGWRAWWGVLGTALSEPAGAPPPLGAPSPLLLPSPVSEPFSVLAAWGNRGNRSVLAPWWFQGTGLGAGMTVVAEPSLGDPAAPVLSPSLTAAFLG